MNRKGLVAIVILLLSACIFFLFYTRPKSIYEAMDLSKGSEVINANVSILENEKVISISIDKDGLNELLDILDNYRYRSFFGRNELFRNVGNYSISLYFIHPVNGNCTFSITQKGEISYNSKVHKISNANKAKELASLLYEYIKEN
ncbi:MAG: hypothetical protein K0S41_976 [Anaerocolumna sp.]|jgi:hypothetical protein|nr:hypothetical protein [Anaerocolumna sp.]